MSYSGDAEKNHKHANWGCYMLTISSLSRALVLPHGLASHLITCIRPSMPLQTFSLHSLGPAGVTSRKPFLITPYLPNAQPRLKALFQWDLSLCLSSSHGVKVLCFWQSLHYHRDLTRKKCFFIYVFPAS